MNLVIYLKIPRYDNPIMHHLIGLDSSMLSSRRVKTQTAYCIATARVSITAIKCDAADLSISITVGNTTSFDSFTPISCITIATSNTGRSINNATVSFYTSLTSFPFNSYEKL